MLVDDFVKRSMLEDQHLLEQPKRGTAVAGTIAVHLLLAVAAINFPAFNPPPRPAPLLNASLERVTPLVAPPRMTQRAPNAGKAAAEVNLEGLLSRPSTATPPPMQVGMTRPAAPKVFQAPPSPVSAPPAPRPMIEAPGIDDQSQQARSLPALGNSTVATLPPPPQIEVQERPKLAFEKPGSNTGNNMGSGMGAGRIPRPEASTVEAAARHVARGGGAGLVVGDIGEGAGGLGASLNLPNAPLRNGSSLELLSDPMGADFKPYLIRILSSVRRNWLAVLPESARLGRRGKVLIQFAIDRSGAVPKLVIATPSGTEAFDRAAVAGISASNPFPPLPDEFKGPQVRLQFTFLYNIPSR